MIDDDGVLTFTKDEARQHLDAALDLIGMTWDEYAATVKDACHPDCVRPDDIGYGRWANVGVWAWLCDLADAP